MSRPITESRMASTSGLFLLPSNMLQTTTSTATLKNKRKYSTSFLITDILGNRSRSPSPLSSSRHRQQSGNTKDNESTLDEDEATLQDSDDNGKLHFVSIAEKKIHLDRSESWLKQSMIDHQEQNII